MALYGTVLAAAITCALACLTALADEQTFTPHAVRVGDPSVSYANVEFTADGRYMVWFEMDHSGRTTGTAWHCGVDPQTGDLAPADGKGFRAFDTTVWGRPNPGMDSQGPYYVGMDRSGRMVMVRPTDAAHGAVTVLSTPAGATRRAVYPTNMPDRDGGYVYWIKNEKAAGSGSSPRNDWFELQVIGLERPGDVRVVAHQDRPARGFAPMDFGFARWMGGTPLLTYGAFDDNGRVQVMAYDADRPGEPSRKLTDDACRKIDSYGWTYRGGQVLLSGIDGQAVGHVYARGPGETAFRQEETVTPPASKLARPGLAQSFEPIVFGGRAYAAYQINDLGLRRDFRTTTFGRPGEIWLTTLFEQPQQQWRLAPPEATPLAEPEPFVGADRVWVFYSRPPADGTIATGTWELWRADTPPRAPGGGRAGE